MLAPAPTHVDDEAVLVATLLGLWRASLIVLAAGHAAGLVVELRECRGVVVTGLEPGSTSGPDGCRVTGASGDALRAVLSACRSGAAIRPFQRECRCKVKTSVAPSAGAGAWRRAARFSSFGPEAVVRSAPYLGCPLTSPGGEGPQQAPRRWPRAAVVTLAAAAWGPVCDKVAGRAHAVVRASTSAGARARL
eukprot:12753665-Alexandrium_andersonii.AAC.2